MTRYSQFAVFLPVIHQFILRELGIKSLMYTGAMSTSEREATLNSFRTLKNSRILLMTLKAGSVGLNLSEANHVILMDVWWNPHVQVRVVRVKLLIDAADSSCKQASQNWPNTNC